MRFRILGPVGASGPQGEVPLGGPRHRVLLATLLMTPGRVVSADRLSEALWGDTPPGRAIEMLHVRISELRKLLRDGGDGGADLIVTRRPGYLLNITADQVDAYRYEQAAIASRRALIAGDAAAAAEQLGAALALWQGPALADIADRPFAQPEITRLEILRVQGIEDRISAKLAMGQQREVLAELEGLVRAHRLHERYRFQLMLALYREGRQNDALEVYQQASDRLRDELGIDPGTELQELRLSILRQDPALMSPHNPSPYGTQVPNLPAQLTSFVGRESEAADVLKQFAGTRLVTLTGAGGVGKTRLAVEIARTGGEAFPDGAWIAELATLQDPALIESAVAAALGVRQNPHQSLREAIVYRLSSTTALLVLDNCEHLLDGVAGLVRHLLQACPSLRILCTSRERISVTGEAVWPLAGLSVPATDERSAAAVGTSSAVKLFVDRAMSAQPHFRLTDDNVAAVAQITRHLDGLPLAIELAAARTATFGARQIEARLVDRFRLLSRGGRQDSPRHQTLRAVVAWSYGLLTEPEQRFFDKLAVFVGGFTFDAAEAVCADTEAGGTADDPADLLARLVDKSLIVVHVAESPEYRYRMLETLRVYGLEELTRRSEADRVRNVHARYYLELATSAGSGLRGPDHEPWLDRLHGERSNLRAAMDWALRTRDDETAAGIAASLWMFWDLDGHYREGRDWLRRVLADGRRLSTPARAQALMGMVHLAVVRGDPDDEAVAACRLALQLSRSAGDATGLAHALQYLGFIALVARRLEEARQLLDEAEDTASRAGAALEHARTLLHQALLARLEQRFDDADTLAQRAEMLNEIVGDRGLLISLLCLRAGLAASGGHVPDAARHLTRAIRALLSLGGRWDQPPGTAPPQPRRSCLALHSAGSIIARAGGEETLVVRLYGAAAILREQVGPGVLFGAMARAEEVLASLRARMEPDRFAHEWRSGQEMSTVDALNMALLALNSCQ